jgi:hypothetical protein
MTGPARPVLALLPGRCADCGRLLPLVPNPSVRKSPGTPSRGFYSPLGFSSL